MENPHPLFMFTFKHFSRLSALFIALFVSISAYAAEMQEYIVKNTNSSGPDSFQDAINTVNAEGGSWTIKFEIPSGDKTIDLEYGQTFKDLDELIILGSGSETLNFHFKKTDNPIYKNGSLYFENIKKIKIRSMKFFKNEESNVIGEFHIHKCTIEEFVKCKFIGIGLRAEDLDNSIKVGRIDSCRYTNYQKFVYGNFEVASLKTDTFEGGQVGIDVYKNDGFLTKIHSVENCLFSATSTQFSEYGTISGCTFFNTVFFNCSIKSIEESDFDNSQIYGGVATLGDVEKCTFQNTEGSYWQGAIAVYSVDNINSCIFKNNTENDICVDQLGSVTNSKFSKDTYKRNDIYGGSIVVREKCGVISGNTFDYPYEYNHYTDVGDLEFVVTPLKVVSGALQNSKIYDNEFINGEYCIYNESSQQGFYDNNTFTHNRGGNQIEKAIYNAETIKKPELLSAILKDGKYVISGYAGSNAIVDIYYRVEKQTARRKLASVEADADGKFEAIVDAAYVEISFYVSATATYEGLYTSELSELYCGDLPLNIYVKENGEGNGSNWENAMGPADVRSALKKCQDGTTFHYAAGEYSNKEILEKSVNIIGGYPDKATTGAKSDARKNKTIIKGGFGIKHYVPSEIKFSKLYFENSDINMSDGLDQFPVKKIELDSCYMTSPSTKYLDVYAEEFYMRNSFVDRSLSTGDILSVTGLKRSEIEGCTFVGNGTLHAGGIDADILMKNSTVFSTTSKRCIGLSGNVLFENNTVINNSTDNSTKEILSSNYINAIGSIFYFKEDRTLVDAENSVFSNNIISSNPIKNNYSVSNKELSTLLDGTYDEETGVFTPNLTVKEGGFVPTISLLKDKLADDISIRFKRLDDVVKDANNVNRLTNTCPGAVELERENLSLKSVFVDVYGSKCIGKEGYIEVSWTDKSYNTSSYQFKMVLTDENGKKIEGALQDQSAGSGTFQITGLKNGTYSFELYVKKADNFVAATCDAVNIRYSNFSPSIDETPTGKNKFIMVEPKDAFHVTYITAGAGRKNDNDPNEPACKLDDHKIRMTVKGGTAPYTFSIYNSNNKLIIRETPTVNLDADGYFSYTSRLLAPDSYVVYVSDASGCEYGDDVHANFTAKHHMTLASYERSCDSKNSSHIKIKTQGEPLDNLSLFVDKLSEVPDTFVNISPVGKRYVDLLGIYKSGMSTFEDGCVAFSPIVVEPLSQSFIDELYKIRIDKPYEKKDQTCYGVDNGSFTIYPKAEFENDIYGNFTYFCVLVDAVTKEKVQKKEGIILLDQPVTFEGVAPGKYSAYFSYQMGLCDVGQRTDFLKFAEIAAVKEPVITNMNDIPVIRCKDKTATQKFNVVNYDKNIYTWELTKDDEDITSKVDATVPTTEEGEFVFKGLTAGDYVFSLVDQCGNPFSKSFTVLESLKKTMKVVDNSGGVSCEGKSDAYFDINVTNWNTGDKCSITNAETGEELEVSKTTKGTYISFFTYYLPGGKYNVDVTDLCGTTYPTVVVDLDELGKESKFGVMLEAASDEPCNDDYHKILATVSGIITSEPYTFTLYKEGEEEELDSKQNVDESSYTSGKLDNGNYKLVVENGLDCKAEATFTVKPVSMQSLANISIDNVDYEDQTCFGVDNGEITVRYSGNSTLTPLKLVATSANGTQSVVTGSAEKAKLTITDLAPGTYDLVLDHNLEGCETSATSAAMQLGKVTITGLSGQLSIDAASLVKTQPTCAYPFNGTVEVDIHNWVDGSSNVTVYRNGSPQWGTFYANFGEYTSNAPGLLYYVDEEHRAANIVHLKFPKASGTIMVQVKDECDYIATLDDIQLEKFEKPSISLVEEDSHLDLDCNSSADGRLVFAVAGESASLFSATYKAENGDLITAKPDETGKYIITDLSAGQYTFGINSTVDGCKDAATETVEITAPRPIEIHKLSPAPVVCVAEGTTAYASVGGGTPDYTYRWTDAKGNLLGTGDKVEHLSVGNDYKLVVTDSKLCKDSATFNVGAYQMDPLTDISVTKFGSKDQTCFGVDNGEIRVYYSGNTSETPLKLLVIGADGVAHKAVSASENGNIVVTDLAPGVYSVFLDYDNEWCEQETPAAIALGEKTISPVGELAIDKKSLVINVATCSKPMNGSAEIDVLNWVDGGKITVYRNGSPQWGTVQCEKKPYTSPAPGWFYYENAEKMAEHTAHLVIPRIDGGDFKVEVIDNCEDTVTYEFVHEKMLGPAFAYADDQVLDLKCSTDSYGKIAFHTTGGSIFSYYVNDEEMTTDGADKYVKDNLSAGTYTVSSKSKLEGCKDGFKEEVVITAPPALVASPKVEPVYCDEVGATAKANVVGGTPGFTYSWTDAEGNEVGKKAEVSHLKADETFTLVVTDANMCQTNSTVSPKYAAPLTSISVNKVEEKHQKCYGVDNGEITVSFSGNTSNASLKFVAIGADGKPVKAVTTDLEDSSVDISGLAPGSYDVRLGYNVSGCETSDKAISVAKDLVILALDKPVFLKDKKKVEDNPCENIGKGRMHLEMVGWTPDVYKWTLKRAGQTDAELEPQSHCGDKLPNGVTAFDLMTLPEGENVFTMWDACGTIHSDTAIIGHRDLAPITIDTVNSKAYSCEGRTDGRFTFVAWPWDVEDSAAVLKNGKIGIEDFKPEVKDGKAYFELKGQGAGVYTLVTTDLCGREESKENNFTDFSAKNGRLTVGVDFNAEAAKCDVEERIFKVTATGGTAPYIYTITKGGATVQTTEATEKKSFNSQLLTDGTYVVTVTDKTDCKAVYDNGLTIKPSHTMKAKNRDVICGDIKQSLVYASIDNGTTLGLNYIAIDESGKEYLPLQDGLAQYGICTFELPTNVTLKGLIAKVDEQCSVYADLESMPLDESALAEAKVTIDTLIHQRCYGIDNAELRVNYSGPKTTYDMKLRLKNVDNPDVIVDTENKHGEELQFKFKDLAPGNYELYLVQAVGKCDAGLEPRKIQDISIKAIPHPFELLWDTVIQSTCYSKMNGNPAIKVHGWSEGNCTWMLTKFDKKEGYYKLEATNTDAYPVSGDSAYWSSDHLDAGLYKITWMTCNASVSKEFEIEPLKEPSLKVLASSNTDLKCGYDKAYVDFHYEGGVPMNKRILIKYIPVGSSDEDWDFTTEELKAENTYRLYGFTPGSGNMGHKKVEGTDYVLTDEDNGLPDGKYHIFYEDATKKCQGDDVHATVEVQRPYVNLNLAKQDVLCFSENYGVINLVPTRSSKDVTFKYQFMDEFKQSKVERTEGQNFGEVIFKNPVEQKTVFQNRKNFLSYVFYDVESVSLEAKSMPQDELYKLMQDSIKKRGTNMRNPLSKFYKDGGYEYAVSDWIGFNMLPADMYYVTVNDIYGCQYKDSIEVKGPEDALRVTEAKYPMGADPECNAEDRRIKFTCTGGYYPYYYNVVNLDEEVKDDYDVSGSGMASIDYVADSKTEKYIQNGKQHIDYTSKMLKPGHYEVSVMDTMGCIAKWKHVIDVKAKHVLNAVPHVDVCDPASDNKLEILYPSNDAKSYTLYIGHRTHCVYYPYCSVDDKNGGLQVNEGKSVHVHKCDESLYKDCDHFENCLEKRNAAASTINYKDKVGNSWISKTGFGLSSIPSGTIGVLVTMEDGCTAFDEYVYKSSGLPTSLAEAGTDPVKCNGDNTGALTFSLFGGNDRYTSIKLDGEDLAKTHPQLQMITTTAIPIKDEFGGKSYDYITDKKNISVNKLLSDKSLFEDLRKYYDGEALYKEAVATLGKNAPFTEISKKVSELKHEYSLVNYAFRIDDLLGTVNWENEQENKKHILTVVDEQECQTSMEFDIYQPTKLNLDIAASVICPDGSGRIYAESTTGGVPPYEYRMDTVTTSDINAVFIPETGKKPKTYDGVELQTPDAYKEYYVNEYHKGDHIPAGKGHPHYMWVKDANGCEMKSSNSANLSEIWAWDKVVQEQFISTWHNYGDVLVVVDPTDYSMVHEKAVYDSMKVIIVMDAEGEGKFEGITQPKELYTYGVKERSFDGEYKGKKDTPFGSYTTSWGIPEKAKEDYNEYLADDNKTLEPIHTYFDKLVSDDAQRRMTFVKFQTPAGKEVNLKDLIGNKTDYHLNFMVRVVAYVGGCDIVTEHNPLVLNLKGDEPFPDAHYKDIITVDAFPNPVAKNGKCTLKVTLSNEDNDFEYSVFSLDGRKLQNKRISSYSKHDTIAKDDGNTDYIYEFEISGLTETSIVKVTTETNTAAVKVLVK